MFALVWARFLSALIITASGKPSTWLPLGGLVEQTNKQQNNRKDNTECKKNLAKPKSVALSKQSTIVSADNYLKQSQTQKQSNIAGMDSDGFN